MDKIFEMEEILSELRSQNLLRNLSHLEGIDFSSNDYLSLSQNTESIDTGMRACREFGTGSTSSRLLSGNKKIFEDFENQISADKNTESALIFNSGYIANASVISAFASLGYLLIFDKLNHASMYQYGDGITNLKNFRSDCKLLRFPHLNYEKLEEILEKHKSYPKKLIASETIFGMDGDIADVKILSELAEKYNAILYLDEAHATGLYRKRGYGLSTNFELDPKSTIIMGTFSKALASVGAYIACSEIFKHYLIQVSKGFIYSMALSPFCIGVAQHNWKMLQNLEDVRKDIFNKSGYLRKRLTELKLNYVGSDTNIIPIIFKSTEKMLEVHKKITEE